MPQAQLALAQPLIHHRSEEFKSLLGRTRSRLQQIFRTQNEVLILTSSGTGAMEAAVSNLFSEKDTVLVIAAGKFGERWAELCRAYRVPHQILKKEPGEAASPEEICRFLQDFPELGGVLLQGCETSTATVHDLKTIGERLHRDFPEVLTVVDGITTLGSQPLETDSWNLDVVIGGSQKFLSIPPGLSFLSLSPRAIARMADNPSPRYYLDLAKELGAQRKEQTAFTPAVSMIAALDQATQEILRQGLEKIVEDTAWMAHCTRCGLKALGFRLLSSAPANAVTAAYPPPDISARQLLKQLREEQGILLACGQGDLAGRIVRVAHLGYFDLLDMFSVLSALELALLRLGAKPAPGAGVRAALTECHRSQRLPVQVTRATP